MREESNPGWAYKFRSICALEALRIRLNRVSEGGIWISRNGVLTHLDVLSQGHPLCLNEYEVFPPYYGRPQYRAIHHSSLRLSVGLVQ